MARARHVLRKPEAMRVRPRAVRRLRRLYPLLNSAFAVTAALGCFKAAAFWIAGAPMADIFISYSKRHSQLTKELARDLEAEGYTTWWDTSLLPDDTFFPQSIRAEIEAAKAVIVIWAEHSITSPWVYSEAQLANGLGKLMQVRDEAVEWQRVPLPFTAGNIPPITDRAKIFAALARKQVARSARQLREAEAEAARRAEAERRRKEAEAAKAAAERVEAERGAREQARREAWEAERKRREAEEAERKRQEQAAKPVTVQAVVVRVGPKHQDRVTMFKPGESFRDLDTGPEMVVIPPGKFWMGSKDGEGLTSERPRHEVTIPQPFAAGKYPVTFDEWGAYVRDGAGGFFGLGRKEERYRPGDEGWGRGRRPVINVSWDDAQAYVKWLSEKTSKTYRLLSEAEWEYACRAGTEMAYSFGDGESDLGRYGWYTSNSGGKTHPVGEKLPNGFGLYDMHGNVWEWCEDCWNSSYAGKPDRIEQSGEAWTAGDCNCRVLRGGSWIDYPQDCRAARRGRYSKENRNYDIGFRVARTLFSS